MSLRNKKAWIRLYSLVTQFFRHENVMNFVSNHGALYIKYQICWLEDALLIKLEMYMHSYTKIFLIAHMLDSVLFYKV